MKTVGEILRAARLERKWSLEELAKRTKIQERFLKALEQSDIDHLPEAPFVKGFIRTTASELGLKPDEMVSIFRRDFGADKKGNIIPKEGEEIEDKEFRWTPRLTAISMITVVITTFAGYLLFQLHMLTNPPLLIVDLPKDHALVSQEVLIQGRTDPSATVSINGQEIKKNRNGTFSQTIPFLEGEHAITIIATGQNGKSANAERTIQVKHD